MLEHLFLTSFVQLTLFDELLFWWKFPPPICVHQIVRSNDRKLFLMCSFNFLQGTKDVENNFVCEYNWAKTNISEQNKQNINKKV